MNTSGLLDYQVPAVGGLLHALKTNGAALDASDCGVGKTFHAVAVIRELQLPTLVIVPAIAISSWKRVGQALGTEFDILSFEQARLGNTPFGWWDSPKPKKTEPLLKCTSCQCRIDLLRPFPCPHHYLGLHCAETIKIPHKYGRFQWNKNVELLVVDEVHRCSALTSLQADMLIAAKRQGLLVLGLSATSCDSPIGLRALGYALGLHNLVGDKNFYSWAMKRGCQRLPFRGFHFTASEERKKKIMADLHHELFPSRGVRVRIEDLGDKFPDCQITSELYDIANPEKIDALYREMAEAMALVHEKRDADVESPLTEILRARQELELLKVPVFIDLTNDAVSQGRHVAIFVNFRATAEELCQRLHTTCKIDGSQVGAYGELQREICIEDFQRDAEPVIICTAAAGSVNIGLHDTHGNFPRLGLVSLGFSAREFRQICGRLRRQGGRSKSLYRVILLAGTQEISIHKTLSQKLNNLDALNDADLLAENLRLPSGQKGSF